MSVYTNEVRKAAFTLAEVLITLVIVGIVAALTVPSLVAKYQEQQTISKLESAYSSLSQALRMAELHNGKIDTWDIGVKDTKEGSVKLYNYIAPELQKIKDCGDQRGCFAESYGNLKGNSYSWQPDSYNKYVRGRLNNGVSFLLWSAGSGCNVNYSKTHSGSLTRTCGSFQVDINGDKKPNRAGYDFFAFAITKDGLIPSGTKDYVSPYGSTCSLSSSNASSGSVCTAWVLYKKNFDYKRKEISWD